MAPKPDIEALKKAKDGLDVLDDIIRYSKTGFASIDPDDIPRCRWYGLYQQRPNEGHFMLRVKVPNGDLSSTQIRTCAQIAIDFGRDLIDITTRQNYQYHWLTIENVPEIFQRLKSAGLTTSGACGDITRNIVGCPVAGISADEFIDASQLAKQLNEFFTDNKEFSNLPRKYKPSISGCHIHCAQPDINCIGFYGAEWTVGGKLERGYGLKVGGGLSTKPYFGADLGVFLRPDEVLPVMKAVTEIYRDAPQLRADRGRARLKFLLHDPKIGIGAEEFRRQLEEKLGRTLQNGGPYPWPANAETDHLGIAPQKQQGLYYVGIGVRAGRLSGTKLLRIAEIADEFSKSARIRNTNKQNFIILDIPEDRLEALQTRLREHELDYQPTVFKRAVVSCTGIEFCNLAVTETKELARRVSVELEERFPGATKNVRIHFSGCPNNCGQNAIADIGLRGGATKVDGEMVQAFDILLGGATGDSRAFGEVCSKKVHATHIGEAIGNLYAGYLHWCTNGESFQQYVTAHTKEQLDAVARGNPMPEAVAQPGP